MSMYDFMSGGPHPLAGLFINIVGLGTRAFPRLRDAHLVLIDGEPVVRVLARTGGGNRSDHEAMLSALREHAGFRSDDDCGHDSTYAEICFNVPAKISEQAREIAALLGDFPKFQTRFQSDLARIEGKEPPWKPKEVSEQEVEQLQKAVDSLFTALVAP